MKTPASVLFAMTLLLNATSAFAATDLEQDLAIARAGRPYEATGRHDAFELPRETRSFLASLVRGCLVRPPMRHTGENSVEPQPTRLRQACRELIQNIDETVSKDVSFDRGELLLENGTRLSYITVVGDGMDADEDSIVFYDAEGTAVGSYKNVDDSNASALDYLNDFGSL